MLNVASEAATVASLIAQHSNRQSTHFRQNKLNKTHQTCQRKVGFRMFYLTQVRSIRGLVDKIKRFCRRYCFQLHSPQTTKQKKRK